MFWFERMVQLGLFVAVVVVGFRKYGIHAMATGQRCGHAAIGRAKLSKLFYAPMHRGARVTGYTVRDTIGAPA